MSKTLPLAVLTIDDFTIKAGLVYDERGRAEKVTGTSSDCLSTQHDFEMTVEQFAALQFLALVSESNNPATQDMVKLAYGIVSDVVKDWPQSCRPFP